ncbi:aldehyde dehydrogenase (NADP(+)) [Streptomyces sp. N2-109]|uniref:Aldehyde dehydrogenase (NADP(+)) n=1 Tax=Streptomyces gossypii TaxID=2883101 RepID=A0ABT2K3U2_9ACTN|nr:aldehyde dehydrogenase (NADP(+)) [Streptomyces gossypii]MCT2594641.1 aldehyde dehydrogenase (NADP(+)) [Streptomyces gossypii]
MTAEASTDPRTAAPFGAPFPPTAPAEVARIAAEAAAAAPVLEARGRAFRAGLLRAMGTALEARRAGIVALADRETAIGATRLHGELTRTVYQAGLFADVLDEGSYLEATIDHAGDTSMGPGPDLRRMLVPIGPVAVFGASNFPLAFSVPGGDTVSALAAGSPVIVKAHGAHPATSQLTFHILREAARAAGAPEGTLGLVYGQQAGAALVADPHVKAVAFTGSPRGGRALLDIIAARPEPVPFYGEMSGLNPIVVTEAAAAKRGREIAEGLVRSFTVAAGQLCTKPGLVFVPEEAAGDALVAAARELVAGSAAGVALTEGIHAAYREISGDLAALPGVTVEAEGGPVPEAGYAVAPRLLSVRAAEITPEVTEECFGPLTVLARYRDDAELRRALDALPASLTGTVHSEADEEQVTRELFESLRAKAGRVVHNGFPTGVLVSWAQTHGGPWPSTNSLHTSVGATALRRFLRPVTWQNAPQSVLPYELWDKTRLPRRIDGRLVLQGVFEK